ncbi:MAG: hypothetical protein GY757_36215 [bacterium]|nr:hypothetical protein [bacterium]
MVIIDNLFIHYKQPAQFIYAGENYLDIYKNLNKGLEKTRRFEDVSLQDINAEDFNNVIRELGAGDTGLILNSGNTIFNIFDFEQIPWRDELQKEIVEWRLKKVFPENIDDYNHQFFKLSKNKILSVLFKKEFKEKIEELFTANSVNLTYIGNSTVNILNRMSHVKPSPDFFLEIDRNLSILTFQSNALPFYIRKFRAGKESDVTGEIVRTINYVKNSYSKIPRTYATFISHSDLDFSVINAELAQQSITQASLENKENFLLPG